MNPRTRARRRALEVLFEADQRQADTAAILADRIREPGQEEALPGYAVDIVQGVIDHQPRIDDLIATYSQGWALERMPAVDRAILRLGTWELLFNDDVPDGVALAESVDLARTLSTEDSPIFVNGLLGRLERLKPTLLA